MISSKTITEWLHKHWGTLVLLMVGVLVCGGCLRADFYMDDYQFIVKSDYSGRPETNTTLFGWVIGDRGPGAEALPFSMLIPTLIFRMTYDAFGPSSVAFHVWNLVGHLLLALLVRVTIQKFLTVSRLAKSPQSAARLAFWSALIFLVHPLGTETVNYAKCFYMELVGISAILSCYATICFAESMRLKHFISLVLALGLASFSYPYAFPIAIVQSFLLLLFLAPEVELWVGQLRSNRLVQVLLVAVLAYFGYMLNGMYKWYTWHLSMMEYTYSSHLLTQGRVFWEYVARMVVPTSLCSDHLVAWSTSWADAEAVVKLCFVGVIGLAGLVLAWRKRRQPTGVVALVVLLIMTPLVVRWPYTSHEPMVEYRTYPTLAWVGLLFAISLYGMARWMIKLPSARIQSAPKVLAALGCFVVVIFSALSLQRGTVWRSFGGLAENVLEQYPLSIRAYSNLQYTSFLNAEYQETLALHKEMTNQLAELKRLNAVDPLGRQYDVIWAEKAYLTGEGLCGLALANLEGSSVGISYIEKKIQQLQAQRPELFDESNPQRAAPITPLVLNLEALKANQDKIDRNRRQSQPQGAGSSARS